MYTHAGVYNENAKTNSRLRTFFFPARIYTYLSLLRVDVVYTIENNSARSD